MLISAHAIPCGKNAQWFNDRDHNRIHHERHPGASRLYAIPLADGEVPVGDPVAVEPDDRGE
jgi:MOSC domain-containing protein YiiM